MSCLLAVDVGNTNTVLGVFRGDELVAHWRIQTNAARTSDEYAVLVRSLLELQHFAWGSITHGIISSVVPPAVFGLTRFFKQHLDIAALLVGPGIKTGMPILYENPREVGADRIVNAVAAFEQFKQGCIVVDFGTATTFDLVTPKGEYAGGAIATGITTSADALYHAAAKLPRVELVRPPSVVGKNTVHAMQAGLFYGYVGLTDEIVTRMRASANFPCKVVATGGLAPLIARDSKTIEHTDEMLTLTGLRILYDRNR